MSPQLVKPRLAVIGAGFYGLSAAISALESEWDVVVFESRSSAMGAASEFNQARVHGGYHYPRSMVTAMRSRKLYPKFITDYSSAVIENPLATYLIDKNSKISSNQFRRISEVIGAPLLPLQPQVKRLINWNTVEAGFKATPAQIEAAITPKTKVFMFSSPCNPSGAVYSKAELEALANLFKKYPQITILSDEIYEYINFIGKHESIAQFSEIKDQVIVINGLSKGFAMTGWRLGYTASNITLAKAMEKLQGQFTSGTSSITQKAAVAALVGDLKPSIAMTEEFTRRRTTTLALVNAMPGFKCFAPEGAFYVFPDVSSYYGKSNGEQTITNASDFSMFLLNTAHVSSVMGDAFGEPHCVRFSFANSMENIEKAWARIREALTTLK